MKTAFILSCLVAACFAVMYDPNRKPWVLSKRDDDGNEGHANVHQLIADLLSRARNGITAADLGDAAQEVQEAADEIIDGDGGKVPEPEVQALVQELAASFNGNVAVSALFDDPLTYEGNIMDAGLTLLNALSERAQQTEAAGQPCDSVLAAISMTARAIQAIVVDTVEIIRYGGDNQESNGRAKRWEFTGGYNRDASGGNSYNLEVKHSWKRAAAAAVKKRSVQKRGWEASVSGSYRGRGNYEVGGQISYNWRR